MHWNQAGNGCCMDIRCPLKPSLFYHPIMYKF